MNDRTHLTRKAPWPRQHRLALQLRPFLGFATAMVVLARCEQELRARGAR